MSRKFHDHFDELGRQLGNGRGVGNVFIPGFFLTAALLFEILMAGNRMILSNAGGTRLLFKRNQGNFLLVADMAGVLHQAETRGGRQNDEYHKHIKQSKEYGRLHNTVEV